MDRMVLLCAVQTCMVKPTKQLHAKSAVKLAFSDFIDITQPPISSLRACQKVQFSVPIVKFCTTLSEATEFVPFSLTRLSTTHTLSHMFGVPSILTLSQYVEES